MNEESLPSEPTEQIEEDLMFSDEEGDKIKAKTLQDKPGYNPLTLISLSENNPSVETVITSPGQKKSICYNPNKR